uniref:LysR family transcriptional regulator n=1 Tax=Brugia timori TaxID=42155 RepID=A0A0R3QE91_9BILA
LIVPLTYAYLSEPSIIQLDAEACLHSRIISLADTIFASVGPSEIGQVFNESRVSLGD